MEKKSLNEIREEVANEYLDLLPDAISALRNMIKDPDINPIARVQAVSLVTDRLLGKPEENIRIRNAEADMDEAQKRLDEIFAKARMKSE